MNNGLGDIVREKRKEYGLSQIDLAEGICTQGTISNIENSISFPSTVILKEIAKKLSIDIFEITSTEQDHVVKVLNRVSRYTALGYHEKAYYYLLTNLSEEEIYLENQCIQKRYNYYLGISMLLGLFEEDRAEEIFKNTLERFTIGSEVEDVLIYCGLGILNYIQNDFIKARKWFDTALVLLRNETLFIDENIKEILKLYFNIAKFHSGIQEYEEAIALCKEGIYWANELDTSYHLGYLHYEKGFCLLHLGKIKEAELDYNLALSFGISGKHEVLKKTIFEDAEKYKINLFYTRENSDQNY